MLPFGFEQVYSSTAFTLYSNDKVCHKGSRLNNYLWKKLQFDRIKRKEKYRRRNDQNSSYLIEFS